MGAFPDVHWRDVQLRLEPGSTLVAYTDGITDAQGEGDGRFGFRRLQDTLVELGDRPAGEMMEMLAGRLEAFQAGAHTDDTAAIALRRIVAGAEGSAQRETHEVTRPGTITTPA